MPFPLIPLALGALAGNASAKKPKPKKAVSKYTKKNGTRVKAYTRKVR